MELEVEELRHKYNVKIQKITKEIEEQIDLQKRYKKKAADTKQDMQEEIDREV